MIEVEKQILKVQKKQVTRTRKMARTSANITLEMDAVQAKWESHQSQGPPDAPADDADWDVYETSRNAYWETYHRLLMRMMSLLRERIAAEEEENSYMGLRLIFGDD